jgi:hypothetical protein
MASIEDELLRTELMYSAPEHVHSWLKARAEQPDAYAGDEQLEQALLTRKSDLIELGIARYGFSEAAVRELFLSAPATGHGRALRLAALSNRALAKRSGLIEPMPHRLFTDGHPAEYPHEEALREFVTAAPIEEANALFQNPTIHDDVLVDLYGKEGVFSELSEERWKRLLGATVGNPRLKTKYSGPMDGYGEYSYGRVFDAAWRLAVKLPATKINALILCGLLDGTVPRASSIRNVVAVINRWRIDIGDQDSDLFRNPFFRLRYFLTQLLDQASLERSRLDEDVAVRCAFYNRCRMTPEFMQAAYTVEPLIFLDAALDNDAVWRSPETRELLKKLCWSEKKLDMWYPNLYQGREERFRKKHLSWFEEPTLEKDKGTSL